MGRAPDGIRGPLAAIRETTNCLGSNPWCWPCCRVLVKQLPGQSTSGSAPSTTALAPSRTPWDERLGDPVVTVRPTDGAGVRSDSRTNILCRPRSARTRCNPRNHVADLVDLRLEQLRAWRHAPFAEGRARLNAHAASTGRNRCSSAARGSAPTTRSISCPSRITTSNGIDCAPNLPASPGFASTSTLTTLTCPE